MALPPTIPTSFVPKQPVQTTQRAKRSGMNLFLLASVILMGLSIVGTIATFGYQYFLESSRDKKGAELQVARDNIPRETMNEFLQLNNRLTAGQHILDEHVALSQFFDVLEDITLVSVSYNNLDLSFNDTNVMSLNISGSARSFNALAAQSAAFAAEKRIKRAIFSDISVNDATGLVRFALTAEVDPELIKWNPTEPLVVTPVVAPKATTTSATTTTP